MTFFGRESRGGAEAGSLAHALTLVMAVWSLLLSVRIAARWIDLSSATIAAFALAAALVWWGRSPRSALEPARLRRIAPGALGVVTGYLAFPAWLWASWHAGLALNLDPAWLGDPLPPLAGSPILWLAGVVLAPAFEEPLYRGRLLPALRPKLGAALAIVGSSALFALPHLLPWTVLGVFLGGLGLGAVMHWGRSLALCIGIHAGLNLAGVLHGVPPSQHALPPLAGAIVAAAALAVAFGLLHTAPARVRCGALALGASGTPS